MMRKKSVVLSSYALAATVTLFVALMSGCDQREEVYPAEGNAYALDPEYRAQLDAQVSERDKLAIERRKMMREMDELINKFNGDAAAARATPEGIALIARLEANAALHNSNRLESAKIMRERFQRAVADSERIKRGEAKPIDISKKKEEVK